MHELTKQLPILLIAAAALAACGGESESRRAASPAGEQQPAPSTFESRLEGPEVPARPAPFPVDAPEGGNELAERRAHGEDMPAPDSEREICQFFTAHAEMRAEDFDGGVALVLTPKPGISIGALEDVARRFETRLGTAAIPPSDPSESCSLFEIGRMGGTADIASENGKVFLKIRTDDASTIPAARNQVHDFARSADPR